jgi:hypothetical protein
MDYAKQPPKDFKATMDYKGDQIAKSQKAKEDSIRIASASRDATLLLTTFYAPKLFGKKMTDEEIRLKWKEWQKWLMNQMDIPF